MNHEQQKQRAELFQRMHCFSQVPHVSQSPHVSQVPETFILANAWNAVSARIFEQAGFRALATTSAGIAFSQGSSDGEQLTLDVLLLVVKQMADAVSIPVSVDFEAGYADSDEEICDNVRRLIASGAVGLNIEDGCQRTDLRDLDACCRSISAIAALKQELDIPFVLNGRTDALIKNMEREQALALAIERCAAFAEAGADCVFVPGASAAEVEQLSQSITAPLNVLASAQCPNLAELQKMNVVRVSLGSGPMRAAMAFYADMAAKICQTGTFDAMLDRQTPFSEASDLFT